MNNEWRTLGASDWDVTPEERETLYADWTVYRDGQEANGLCGDIVDFRTGFKCGFEAAGKENAQLREKLAAVEKQVQCGATGLLYAEPILSQLWGIRERFDEEMQNHLKEALAQVRRSSNDIRKLAIIDGTTPLDSMELEGIGNEN